MDASENPKRSSSKPADATSLEFKTSFDGKPDKTINVVAYAFDRQGTLLTSAAVKDGLAKLTLNPDQARTARIFFAPEHPHVKTEKSVTLDTMQRLQGYEATWAYDARKRVYELLPIPEILWRWWYWCSCRVRGRVIKVETLGGVTYEKPVCHARVRICEVDRLTWIIARLPDDIIQRLRDELIWAIERPFPPIPNPPDPPFKFDPGYIDPLPLLTKAANLFGKFDRAEVRFEPQPDNLKALATMRINADAVMLNPQPLPPKAAELAFETRAALTANSTMIVREALIKNVELIKIYWCYWDWLWPWFRYACDEMTVVETDENGRFDTTIWYLCFGDKPDLYFWVGYSIGEVWTTVYHPSIRCNTYWNYACGTDVTIRVTDPRVHGCGDRPVLLGKKVVVKTIGRQVSMGEIYRDSAVPSEKAKEGQVKEGWIDATKPSPFGATLEPRVDFGNGLKLINITHYRWSYRSLGSVSEADWTVMNDILAGRTVSRHYRETTPPMSPVVYKSVQIGPDITVPGYFTIIDPVLPASGEDWEVLDESYDLASAYFATTVLTPGKYELKMELFRKVGAVMVRVDLTAEGVELYEINDPAPLVEGLYSTTAALNDRALIQLVDEGMGIPVPHVVGYRLVVHVDNRECFGNIEDVTINGVTAGPCGFLEYHHLTDNAHIALRASHPASFASFHFRVVRVATDISEASAAGLVDAASVNGFNRAGDTFSKDLTINTLMTSGLLAGQTPCTEAAFAEALQVYALATNGYDRLSYLDGPRGGPSQVDLKAFAITPA